MNCEIIYYKNCHKNNLPCGIKTLFFPKQGVSYEGA